MHIAFLTPEYITEQDFNGGLANYLSRAAQGMKERGHKIEIFTRSDIDETIVLGGITVHRIKIKCFLLGTINQLTRYKLRRSIESLSLSYSLKQRFLRRQKEEPFHVIQVSNYLACGLLLTFGRHPAAIITRISSHEPLWREAYRKPLNIDQKILEFLEFLSVRRSEAVYSPSKLLSRIFKEKNNIEAEVLRPPFFLDTVSMDDSVYQRHLADKKYLFFHGSIGFLKGGEVIAKSLQDILSKYSDMYFAFAGKDSFGPDGNSMSDYIRACAGRYNNRIIFLDVLPHSQLYPVIQHCLTVVLPSLIDNLPNAMLESMFLEKVVIGTRGASFEEFIDDNVSGILIERNNPAALSEAISMVWEMSDERKKEIGREAKRRVAVLYPENTCKELEQYFKKALSECQK